MRLDGFGHEHAPTRSRMNATALDFSRFADPERAERIVTMYAEGVWSFDDIAAVEGGLTPDRVRGIVRKAGYSAKHSRAATRRARKPLEVRLMEKVVTGPGCWAWTGAVGSGGYGRILVNGQQINAHRASWMVHRGPVRPGIEVCHTCDNPPCCNPDHLFLGTRSVNQRDSADKGRAAMTRKTHCKQGHPYDEANTHRYKRNGRDVRACRACARARALQQYYALTPEQKAARVVLRREQARRRAARLRAGAR